MATRNIINAKHVRISGTKISIQHVRAYTRSVDDQVIALDDQWIDHLTNSTDHVLIKYRDKAIWTKVLSVRTHKHHYDLRVETDLGHYCVKYLSLYYNWVPFLRSTFLTLKDVQIMRDRIVLRPENISMQQVANNEYKEITNTNEILYRFSKYVKPGDTVQTTNKLIVDDNRCVYNGLLINGMVENGIFTLYTEGSFENTGRHEYLYFSFDTGLELGSSLPRGLMIYNQWPILPGYYVDWYAVTLYHNGNWWEFGGGGWNQLVSKTLIRKSLADCVNIPDCLFTTSDIRTYKVVLPLPGITSIENIPHMTVWVRLVDAAGTAYYEWCDYDRRTGGVFELSLSPMGDNNHISYGYTSYNILYTQCKRDIINVLNEVIYTPTVTPVTPYTPTGPCLYTGPFP